MPNPSTRKHLFLVVRIVICAAALWLVLSHVKWNDYIALKDGRHLVAESISENQVTVRLADGTKLTVARGEVAHDPKTGEERIELGLKTAWRTSDRPFFLLCLAAFAPVPLIQSLRFKLVLQAQEIHITYWESLKLSVAGNFLNFLAIIGSTGGDVFKAYYISLHTHRKTEAVTTVFLDRIIGLLGLIIMVGLVLALRTVVARDRAAGWLVLELGGVLVLVAAGSALFLSKRVRGLIAPGRWPVIPAGWLEHLRRADQSTQRLLRHRVLLSTALAITVIIHFLAVSAVMLAARALRMEWTAAAIGDYYVYIATGNVVAAVPISFQGAGTMEAVYFLFLKQHGTFAQLLCLAIALRMIHLLWSLPGALVMLTGAYRPRQNNDELQPEPEPGLGPA